MIAHHEEALEMAERLGQGTHPIVIDTAGEVSATQSVEIARMQQVLADLEREPGRRCIRTARWGRTPSCTDRCAPPNEEHAP